MYGIFRASVFTLAGFLSGCASILEGLENRAACTSANDQAYVVSMYGPIGIASKISDKDKASICKAGESQ